MTKPGLQAYILLVIQSAIWGSSFQAIKFALEDFGPITIAAGRILLATIVLMLFAWSQGQRMPRHLPTLLRIILVGFFSCALPFFLIPWGEQSVDSGRAAIFMATGPLIAILLAHFTTQDERLNRGKLIGFIIGFIGVILVVGVHSLSSGVGQLMPQLALMIAATSYVVSGLLVRSIHGVKSAMLSACVLLAGSVLTMPAALLMEQPITNLMSSHFSALAALIYLGLLPTGLAFLFRFYLIKQHGYTFLSQVGYLVPLFSVIFGAVLLDEQLTLSMISGLALILSGIYISGKKA